MPNETKDNLSKKTDLKNGVPKFEDQYLNEPKNDNTDPLNEPYNENRFTDYNIPNQPNSDVSPYLKNRQASGQNSPEEEETQPEETQGSDDNRSRVEQFKEARESAKKAQARIKEIEARAAAKKVAEGAAVRGAGTAIAVATSEVWVPVLVVIIVIIFVVVAIVIIVLLASSYFSGSSNVSSSSSNGGGTTGSAMECTGKKDNGFYNTTEAIKLFGNPDSGGVQSELVTVDFLGHDVKFHKKAAGCLEAVVQEIKKTKPDYKIKQIGTFVNRTKRGGNTKSMHSFGIAMDINWADNPFCNCNTHDMPPEWVTAFKNNGFNWGGTWNSKKDWMHFEWHGLAP